MTSTGHRIMEIFAARTVKWASGSWALLLVSFFIFGWLVAGPLLHYSENWHLTMVMVSEPVTFLMVFLLLGVQAKDTRAMHIKLSEIIASLQGANNQLINIEDLSEKAIAEIHQRYERAATHLQEQPDISMEAIDVVEIAEAKLVAEQTAEKEEPHHGHDHHPGHNPGHHAGHRDAA